MGGTALKSYVRKYPDCRVRWHYVFLVQVLYTGAGKNRIILRRENKSRISQHSYKEKMMRTKSFFIQVVVFVLIVVLICACGSAQASPTPMPPTATAEPTTIPVKPTVTTASLPVLDITFDGDECKIVGPDTIPQGKVTLKMHNRGDEEYWVGITDLGEGKTWDDLVEYFGPPGSERSGPPDWAEGTAGLGKAIAGQTSEYSPFLLKGEYGLDCHLYRYGADRIWVGAPLTVEN
jgi:hypothetical protein